MHQQVRHGPPLPIHQTEIVESPFGDLTVSAPDDPEWSAGGKQQSVDVEAPRTGAVDPNGTLEREAFG